MRWSGTHAVDDDTGLGQVCADTYAPITGSATAEIPEGDAISLNYDAGYNRFVGTFPTYAPEYQLKLVDEHGDPHVLFAYGPRLFSIAFSRSSTGDLVITVDPPVTPDEGTEVHVYSCRHPMEYVASSLDQNVFTVSGESATPYNGDYRATVSRVARSGGASLTTTATYVTGSGITCH